MGTMDSYVKHILSNSPDAGATTESNSNDVPKNVEVSIVPNIVSDPNFAPRPCVNHGPYNSTDDDESCYRSHATNVGESLQDSDCDTVLTSASAGGGNKISTANTSVCSSGSSSTYNSRKMRRLKMDNLNKANPTEVDKMLLDELQGLSVVDRGMVQEEIHGVSTCAVSEDEEKISMGLERLEEEIRAIRREVLMSPDCESRIGNTYNETIWTYLDVEDAGPSTSAVDLNSRTRLWYSYIFHRDFRLKFLRADLYDVEKAAHRYLRCIEGLLKYYGSYALQRPLTYEDLGKECQDALKFGYVQILPSRDRAGRLVVVSQACMSKAEGNSMAMVVKLFIYVFLIVSEDVETQKRGVIFVFNTGEDASELVSDPADKLEYSVYREGSPVRRSCTHFCLPENNHKMRVVRAVMMLAMPREERVRTRIHMDGLTMETQYKLMTFGIPVSELPITSTGAIKVKYHLQWIKTRKALDSSRTKSFEECCKKLQERNRKKDSLLSNELRNYPTYDEFLAIHGKEPIFHPMINDVLFSKGGKNVSHYGNIEFTDLMKRSLMQYVSNTPVQNRKMRKAIRQSIVNEIRDRGGRFLTLDKKLVGGYCWTEIQEGPDLHDRIATSLYDHKRRLAAKLKMKSNRCSTGMFIESSKRRKIVTADGEPVPDGFLCGFST